MLSCRLIAMLARYCNTHYCASSQLQSCRTVDRRCVDTVSRSLNVVTGYKPLSQALQRQTFLLEVTRVGGALTSPKSVLLATAHQLARRYITRVSVDHSRLEQLEQMAEGTSTGYARTHAPARARCPTLDASLCRKRGR